MVVPRTALPQRRDASSEFSGLDREQLATYARPKGLGIEPVLTADHGASTAFYDDAPDRNSVELTVDNFGDWKKWSESIRTSPEFAANPEGTHVDPDKMIAARAAGMSVNELHQRLRP